MFALSGCLKGNQATNHWGIERLEGLKGWNIRRQRGWEDKSIVLTILWLELIPLQAWKGDFKRDSYVVKIPLLFSESVKIIGPGVIPNRNVLKCELKRFLISSISINFIETFLLQLTDECLPRPMLEIYDILKSRTKVICTVLLSGKLRRRFCMKQLIIISILLLCHLSHASCPVLSLWSQINSFLDKFDEDLSWKSL